MSGDGQALRSGGAGNNTLLEECSSRVLLSVGGVRFETSLQTLRAVPDSELARSFSDNWRSFRNNTDTVLIDRRGDTFVHIREYLRACRRSQAYLVPILSPGQFAVLKREAEVYGLACLAELISGGENWIHERKQAACKQHDDMYMCFVQSWCRQLQWNPSMSSTPLGGKM